MSIVIFMKCFNANFNKFLENFYLKNMPTLL